MQSATPSTLVQLIASRRDRLHTNGLVQAGAVLFVTVLTAASAQLSVHLPYTAVPLTLQPMIVLMGGLALGSRLGAASQLLYLAAGVAGLPVFATSLTLPPGAARLLGPTGGYLMAYPLAAFLTGALSERGFNRRYLTSVLAMCAGLFVVYAGGVTWLATFLPETGPAALAAAFAAGAAPFLVADVMKLAVAGGAVPLLWRLFGYRPSTSKY